MKDTPFPKRTVRSFVLRQGRLTKGQQFAMDHLWPQFGLDASQGILDLAQCFGRQAPITLEIGFGNGESLASMAKAAPERDFIGIEVHTPGVGHLLHLIQQYSLSNLRIMNTDAIEILQQCIPEHSLERVQLYFPDPWHKKRHHKRRIVQTPFVSLIASRLAQNGLFHLATDWQDYAEHMASVMDEHPDFRRHQPDSAYCKRPEFRPLTKFEQRGLRLGHGIWDLLYCKR